jgi:hypothetical protein
MCELLKKAEYLKNLRPQCERTDRIVRSMNMVIADISQVMEQFDLLY